MFNMIILIILKVLYIVLVLFRIMIFIKFNLDMDKFLLFLGMGIDFFINCID